MSSPEHQLPPNAFDATLREGLQAMVATQTPAPEGRRQLLRSAAAHQRRHASFWPAWFEQWLHPERPFNHYGASIDMLLCLHLDWLAHQPLIR